MRENYMLLIFKEMSKDDMYRMVHSVYIEASYEIAKEKNPELADLSDAIKKEEFYFVEKFLGKFMSKNENTYYVLEENNKWVSALRLTKFEDFYYMEALETAPEYRKKGYACKLIQEVIRYLGEGVVIRSNVRKTNTASLVTHKKCGFVIEEEDGFNPISGVRSDRLYGMLYSEE